MVVVRVLGRRGQRMVFNEGLRVSSEARGRMEIPVPDVRRGRCTARIDGLRAQRTRDRRSANNAHTRYYFRLRANGGPGALGRDGGKATVDAMMEYKGK